MNLIQTMTDTIARVPAPVSEIVGHLGFVLALRRELLPMPQDPFAAVGILGMRIIESEHIPPGHYMINGVSYRYTKPTIDEMVAEAERYLADALAGDVEVHKRAIARGFKDARERLGVCMADFTLAELMYSSTLPFFLREQAA